LRHSAASEMMVGAVNKSLAAIDRRKPLRVEFSAGLVSCPVLGFSTDVMNLV
jgi:hypothetical protein